MALILDLPEQVEQKLYRKAAIQALSPETVALALLREALASEETDFPSPEDIVKKIKRLPPNPHALRPAQGSLADALHNAPTDPNFDLDEWNKEWRMIETEMRTLTHANELAEGR